MGTLIVIACIFIIIALASSLLDSSEKTLKGLRKRQIRKREEYYTEQYKEEKQQSEKPKVRFTKIERIIMGLDDEDNRKKP